VPKRLVTISKSWLQPPFKPNGPLRVKHPKSNTLRKDEASKGKTTSVIMVDICMSVEDAGGDPGRGYELQHNLAEVCVFVCVFEEACILCVCV
jgi:hypothetical protein